MFPSEGKHLLGANEKGFFKRTKKIVVKKRKKRGNGEKNKEIFLWGGKKGKEGSWQPAKKKKRWNWGEVSTSG